MTDSNPSKLPQPITVLLQRAGEGDASASKELFRLVYAELRRIAASRMRRERVGHTLDSTALVHEVFIRMAGLEQIEWRDRRHFYGAATEAFRRVLVDHSRKRNAARRPNQNRRVPLTVSLPYPVEAFEMTDLSDALEELKQLDDRQHEIVHLRFFGGLKMNEIAEMLSVSKRTVEGEWTMARSWLKRRLKNGSEL